MLVGYCRLKKKRRSTITDLLCMTDTGGVHMEEYRLCNSDYRFMTLVWEHGQTVRRVSGLEEIHYLYGDQAVEPEGRSEK